MKRSAEVASLIWEAGITGVEKTHTVEFLLGLSYHTTILNGAGKILSTPYGVLAVITAFMVLLSFIAKLRKEVKEPVLAARVELVKSRRKARTVVFKIGRIEIATISYRQANAPRRRYRDPRQRGNPKGGDGASRRSIPT